ncbi:hypothetical protein DL768_003522 [Monosporascus sp. mg162]|nr:hypothetical protein DL768_003522 [Monosporascus sp. mg162]
MVVSINWRILSTEEANKRLQVGRAVGEIDTNVTFLLDASASWGANFLTSALAPFEDIGVYLVGTNKRVRVSAREDLELFLPVGFLFNFVGSTYLGRHNVEIRATNKIDGGLFAVSGQTMGIRTAFLKAEQVLHGILNERVTKKGHKVKIQYTEDARVEIAAQFTFPSFLQKSLRWTRSTFRSIAPLCSWNAKYDTASPGRSTRFISTEW